MFYRKTEAAMIMISFDNYLLRELSYNDIDGLFKVKNNKQASYLLGGIFHEYTYEDIEKWIEFHKNKENELMLIIEDVLTHRIIGHIALYDIDYVARKSECGILIAFSEYWGKGIGSKSIKRLVDYAFHQYNLHKISAEVLADNIASLSMFKKCGFVIDGKKRDDIFKNGRYYDVYSLSLLDTDIL